MRSTLDRLAAVALCAALGAGCAARSVSLATPPSPLELREVQTRDLAADDEVQVTRATIQALQDEGFVIVNADGPLGLISATRELTEQRRGSRFTRNRVLVSLFTYGLPLLLPGSKQTVTTRLEATVTVAPHGELYRVRASLVYRLQDNEGRPVESRPVHDPLVYQSLFESVDKALFLARGQV